MRKVIIGVSMTFVCVAAVFGDVTISNVKAEPISPWNKVYLEYEVAGSPKKNPALYDLEIVASNRMTGVMTPAHVLSGDTSISTGVHRLVWDLEIQGIDLSGQELNFLVSYREAPLYKVVDLSGGPSANFYPVCGATDVSWNNADRNTELFLRRIDAGTFQMQNVGEVTLTKPFYIGVFEITQRQWELVMGTRPSEFSCDDYYLLRPVECVSFDMIRGSVMGAGYPNSTSVDANSFLGLLRSKTGLNFDLPTEAQWEYACRAGTTTDYNNGKSNTGDECTNMNEVGRYRWNGCRSNPFDSLTCSTLTATAKTASYLQNSWGLYDMHGNVDEWCLDWYGTLSYGGDPVGQSSGSTRVVRGGCWNDDANRCTSSSRGSAEPSYACPTIGFRIALTR